MEKELLFGDLTQTIIKCAMKVHSHFGSGFHEKIYERSLIIDLRKAGLICKSQKTRMIYYEGELVGSGRLDIVVDDKVLIELKSTHDWEKGCFRKTINYLKIFDLEVGLLINFGKDSLEFKRFIRSKNP